KLLITVADQAQFDKGVSEVIDEAERQGRITHINVPPEKMDQFADLADQLIDKVDASSSRSCPEIGGEFKATWSTVQSAEASAQPQQPGMALSQSQSNLSSVQPTAPSQATLSQQPGLALSTYQQGQPPSVTSATQATAAQTPAASPLGTMKIK
ncbi:MAG: hypothetical protein R3F37_00005, partial [Candidatus Competibacteraceae bacterium]